MRKTVRLPGQPALSEFRLAQLVNILRAIDARVCGLSARFEYFIESTSTLSITDRSKILELLVGEISATDTDHEWAAVSAVPRFGTISPWSSKATDIFHACGLQDVLKVERGITYAIGGVPQSDTRRLSKLGAKLHDRMTETLILGAAQLEISSAEGETFQSVPLLKNGITALTKINEELGLALSNDELRYLHKNYLLLARDPTDVELMMFAQANSEHCRHKIFNADWVIDGNMESEKLFPMIKITTAASPEGVISAYSDNAAVIEGWSGHRLMATSDDRKFACSEEMIHILMKVETHNHPTAISPFAGAATGSGGEIRDEGATGLGGKPKAGLTGFSVSHLRIPGLKQPWESSFPHPDRVATPLQIMLDGPVGGAAFNNEFGRPNLLGYFRSYEYAPDRGPNNLIRGYHKPIMIAGGMGNIRAQHALKIDVAAGDKIVVLGGPAMLIGLGGGAASSLSSGSSTEDLDFASVQRGNPEIERRAQEVIDRCCAMGDASPILLIHDVGAGGLSNAVPEAVDHSKLGAQIELRDIPNAESTMSPMGIWCNEAQERYVLIISADRTEEFAAICARERCPQAVIGTLTETQRLVVHDRDFSNIVVDMPMDMLLGKTPQLTRDVKRVSVAESSLDLDDIELEEAALRVLQLPAVADKSFLIHIGDRTVGGLTVRDQLIGPWQVPVSDVAITASGFSNTTGEAMAMGERTPLATLNAPASGRMAVGEAITNMAAAPVNDLKQIRLSANWMAAAGHPGEDANLFDTVRAVGAELCRSLGIAIPVGKDSMSLKTTWTEDDSEYQVVAPLSLIVSAFAPVSDVRKHLTPQLVSATGVGHLLLLDLSDGANRLGASVLAQVFSRSGGPTPDLDNPNLLKNFFAAIQKLSAEGFVSAYHDRSDGGLFATIAEMMFAGHCGARLRLAGSEKDVLAQLFNEELGAVLQIQQENLVSAQRILEHCEVAWIDIGEVDAAEQLSICNDDEVILRLDRIDMQRAWSETSWKLQSLRDNPATAKQQFDAILDADDPGIQVKLTFDTNEVASPAIGATKPKIAVLREQGVNSQYEMAAAFMRAGFDTYDVHMSDLVEKRESLADYQGLVACGGFSFGDVLGAGGGWAKSILYNAALSDEFAKFFERSDSFALGVCNGCQMMSHLRSLIPGAEHWPAFLRNESEQFEARFGLVKVARSPSILLRGMEGSWIPIATSHGEGRAVFRNLADQNSAAVALRYVDNYGAVANTYPANPNGSGDGICGLTTDDGSVTIMMPHPERVALTMQNSWHPEDWGEEGPWMRMFHNARMELL